MGRIDTQTQDYGDNIAIPVSSSLNIWKLISLYVKMSVDNQNLEPAAVYIK